MWCTEMTGGDIVLWASSSERSVGKFWGKWVEVTAGIGAVLWSVGVSNAFGAVVSGGHCGGGHGWLREG
jgi:hypothetical protein